MPETQTDDDALDDAYALDGEVIDAIYDAIAEGSKRALLEQLTPLHVADIADLMEQMKPADLKALVDLWGDDFDPSVLPEVDEGVRDDLLEMLPEDVLREAVKELETDDLVYVVEDLDGPDKERILDALDEADRAAVLASLQFPEYSAGRMMQRAFVMAPTHWTVGDAIDHLRGNDTLPDQFYEIVVVDPRLRPVGTVALAKIMSNRRDMKLALLMEEDFFTIRAVQSREDVGYAFAQYHLISAPVVDNDGRIVGIITIDDAVHAMEEESHEDMMRLAGVAEDEELSDTIWETARQRFPWLLANLVTAILASFVIAFFSETLEAIVALAVLMGIVASMGGNGGTQSMTVAVRAIATRDITSSNAWRIVWRETAVGLLNGMVFAVIVGAVSVVWFGSFGLAGVLAVAMIGTMMIAGFSGILIPLGLARAGVDPALASGAFVTAVTDVVGFLAFLGLASLLLL